MIIGYQHRVPLIDLPLAVVSVCLKTLETTGHMRTMESMEKREMHNMPKAEIMAWIGNRRNLLQLNLVSVGFYSFTTEGLWDSSSCFFLEMTHRKLRFFCLYCNKTRWDKEAERLRRKFYFENNFCDIV